jgi:hypothetical protein
MAGWQNDPVPKTLLDLKSDQTLQFLPLHKNVVWQNGRLAERPSTHDKKGKGEPKWALPTKEKMLVSEMAGWLNDKAPNAS